MGKKQNQKEYERCKEAGLLGRLSLPILKEFGTDEEIIARIPTGTDSDIPEKPISKPKKKKGRK